MEIYEGKRHLQQQQSKTSRSPSPEPAPAPADSFRPIPRTPPSTRVGPPPSPPVPTHPVAPVAPEPTGPQTLQPCSICGRTFLPQSLSKHEKICEKMTIKKRKTFDSSRQRREGLAPGDGASNSGTDLEQYLPKNFGLPENSPFLEKSPPNTAKITPKPKPQSVRAAITKPTSELQKCPHCARAFGPRAFERHVEWCGDKAKILPAAPAQPPPHVLDAKQRLNARTQYKAPPVRARRSSQTREKTSNSRSASVESSRGVSPPPPREYGDYRTGRVRASESQSSNEHEDTPHVPLIRTSRAPHNSGDAHVKARQARLARDLSSSRKPQESQPSSVQPSTTDPNIKKSSTQNKTRLTVKKKQQLQKLEELANKYKEKAAKEVSDISAKKDKTQIPVIRKKNTINSKNQEKVVCDIDTTSELKNDVDISKQTKSRVRKAPKTPAHEKSVPNTKEKAAKTNTKKNAVKLVKENSMSLDSLEDTSSKKCDKNCQSIGINTELLCPSIPCIIYENPEMKKHSKNRKAKSKDYNVSKVVTNAPEPKIELLYKNLTVVSSCDIEAKSESINICKEDNMTESNGYNTTLSTSEPFISDFTDSTSNILKGNQLSSEIGCQKAKAFSNEELKKDLVKEQSLISEQKFCNESQSAEMIKINFDRNVSAETFDYSVEHNGDSEYVDENSFSRHGSGETYTKFTENAEDLEEFLSLTDKMINDKNDIETFELDKEIENLCTPKTNSIEAININSLENISNTTSDPEKRVFSDTFEELKNNLNELLKGAKTEPTKTDSTANNIDEPNRKVCDMEHITVYGLKLYDNIEKKPTELDHILDNDRPQVTVKYVQEKQVSQFKLPNILENNKLENNLKCNKKRMQRIYKPNRKSANSKLLGEQNRANTFIKNEQDDNSDNQSITSEAPPFKLPRIENKRLDDNYDPFVSAARQMKELMSSDTNIPKKIASKDPNRTLPILRPAKEKTPASFRTDNTKMMKDTLNKTYQKTPTLQRMKSFGSTNNENTNNTIGSRCSSFRLNRNDKKSSQSKLNTTFTKSSKENVGTMDKSYFNRNSSLNRSFSSYTASNYSTPKPKDKIPKIQTSMYHSFQRSTIKQPLKLDKINRDDEKKNFVNLDIILTDDNSSMTDSNYIDPRLINENDNLPINVNTILNNPDIISSMESLLTTENLPAKFESFNTNNKINNNDSNDIIESKFKSKQIESNNNNIKSNAPTIDDLSAQYDKIMTSLEQNIASKTSIRDDDSLCEDFDLEEFMTSFDEEINKQKTEKRTCSSTTRVVKRSELADSNRVSEMNSICSSPKVVKSSSNGMIPVNKSMSLNFSSNNVSESLFPSSVKRSTSLLDSIQKKNNTLKQDSAKSRKKADQLEHDLMQSLKDFDKFYETERHESKSGKEKANYNTPLHNSTTKRDPRLKMDRINRKAENVANGNYTPNGKVSNDSAYSSLNRISPSKLSLCPKEAGPAAEAGSDSHDARSLSSDEFLAMERSAELDEQPELHASYKEDTHVAEKRGSSRASSRHSGGWRAPLSSSGSDTSLARDAGPRLSRFCHECGHKFPVDSAKFCIQCGVKRLRV